MACALRILKRIAPLDIAWEGRPRILGHEIVGTIVDMGPKSFNRQELELGDRVCPNAFVPCGLCARCMVGDFGGWVGREERLRDGAVATEVAPSLWGGYATHAFVPKNGSCTGPSHIGAYDASLWQSIAGGFERAVTQAGMKVGDRVLILGPGQRGIGAMLALIYKNGTLRAWAGLSDHSFRLALDYLVKNVDSLSRLRTHVFGFDQLDIAIDVLTGQVPGEHASTW